ncbi:TPA: hypothetical protein DDW35_05840, partial [Candidatus Sumerlaeota bacterium]|nr:hypothetical protein [Candidatus Sumerlaeota bacterium]
FDGNPNSKWYTNVNGATGWLQYQFPKGDMRTVSGYKLTSANDAPERDPMDWEFQGSNDGTNWTTLDTKKGEIFEKRRMTKTYSVSAPAAYNAYRLNVTANKGGAANSIQLAELSFTYADTEPSKESKK